MMKKTNMYIMHSAYLDLFWMGSQDTCLEWGTGIIRDAVDLAEKDADFHFLIETVRFLEYYLYKYPEKKELLKRLVTNGQIEIAADYTDRMENQHDGESLLRNVLYGKKVLKELLDVDTVVSYHPDIPGFAEQMPQLYQKSGITFSLTARGFRMGARFFWKALDDSKVVMYDFPRHYAYYSIEEEVLPHMEEIKKNVSSDDIILSCSAGDLGPANTFSTIENKKWKMVILTDFIRELNAKYPDLNFKMAGIVETLKKMDASNMKTLSGEIPSRWGLNSARDFNLFLLDKIVSRELLEAEKYSTVCEILGIPAEVEFDRHPLKHRGYSGGVRNGVCISSNHSAFDFNGTDISSTLVRDVRNCGEHDARHSNFGELNYDFSISSYSGSYETNKSYRTGFEMLYPLQTVQKTAGTVTGAAQLPAEASFIDTDGNGILTVLKKSDKEDGKYIVRIFNNDSTACPLNFKNSLNLKQVQVCDFNENKIDDPIDTLKPYEVKAVKFTV